MIYDSNRYKYKRCKKKMTSSDEWGWFVDVEMASRPVYVSAPPRRLSWWQSSLLVGVTIVLTMICWA